MQKPMQWARRNTEATVEAIAVDWSRNNTEAVDWANAVTTQQTEAITEDTDSETMNGVSCPKNIWGFQYG